jgi:hypothetical protein
VKEFWVKTSRIPKDQVLEEVRENIEKWASYYLIESKRVEGYKESIEKWVKECRSIPIRLFLAGKNDWEKITKLKQVQYKKTEPSTTESLNSQNNVIDGTIIYKSENPDLELDLIVMNRHRFLELQKYWESLNENGWDAFRTYLYVLHHEVFHSYERYIYETHRIKLDLINPSRTLGPNETGYDDEVLLGLVKDFPKKDYFYDYWLPNFSV